MYRLSQNDCEQLLGLTADLYAHSHAEPAAVWRQRFLRGLRGLIPYEFAGCHLMDPAKSMVIEALYEPEKPQAPLGNKDFWRVIRQHPLSQVLFDQPKVCWRISDLTSRLKFRQTQVFDVLYRPLGVDCELAVGIPCSSDNSQFLLVSLHRGTKDFSERERGILNLILPHVARVGLRSVARVRPQALPALDPEIFSRTLRERSPWKLTSRESEVLFWLQQGKTNGEIGRILGISERTAETHALRAYPKLGVENRFGAIVALGQFMRQQPLEEAP